MALKLNERYPSRFNNPSVDYPQGSFKNRTTSTSKDGSYLEKDWANDKEGFFQSLLSAAIVTANGYVDKVGSSQYYNSLLIIIRNAVSSSSISWGNITGIPAASTATFGVMRIATQPQVDDGTDLAAAVTSATLAARLTSALSSKANKATTLSGYGITDAPTTAQMNTALSGKIGTSGGSIAGSLNIDSPQSLDSPALTVSTSVTGSSLSLIRLTGPNTGILLSHQNNTNTISVSNISGAVAAISAGDVLSSGSLCHTAASFMKPVAGQWVSLTGGATLPAGGTWAYQITTFNSTGTLTSSYAGLVAGGTVLGSTYSVGFAWRYQ